MGSSTGNCSNIDLGNAGGGINGPPLGGGAGGSSNPATVQLQTINVTANALKCNIKHQAHYNTIEYSAFLYSDNGSIKIGPIIAGYLDHILSPQFPPGVSASQIIAF